MQLPALPSTSEAQERGTPLNSNRKAIWHNCSQCYEATASTHWVRHAHTVMLSALTQPGNLQHPAEHPIQGLQQNGLPEPADTTDAFKGGYSRHSGAL